MKRLLKPLIVLLTLPSVVHSSHLNNQRELIVTSESTRESINLAKYLKDNGVVKYSHIGVLIALIKVNYLVSKLIENLM